MSKSGLIGLTLALPIAIASPVQAKDTSLSGGSPPIVTYRFVI
jgi:hypothetical protein